MRMIIARLKGEFVYFIEYERFDLIFKSGRLLKSEFFKWVDAKIKIYPNLYVKFSSVL